VEEVRTLEDGARILGEEFNLGHRPGICVVEHQGRPLLIVGDEFGYIEFYKGFLSPPPVRLPSEKVGNLDDHYPLGAPATSFPDNNIYPASYPSNVPGAFDIVAGFACTRRICHVAKKPNEPDLVFGWHWPVLDVTGIPAAFCPSRNGAADLLVGEEDGTLRLYRRKPTADKVEFESGGEPVLAADECIRFDRWCYPCIVDWDGTGRQDLLVGTAEGKVFLFRDVGDDGEVRFARAAALRTPSGLVDVGSFAAPAAIQREDGIQGLLVANGNGDVVHYPIRKRQTFVTHDLGQAFSGAASAISETYRKGFWWLRKDVPAARNGQVLTTSPVLGKSEMRPGMTVENIMENVPPALELDVGVDGRFEVHVGFHEPEAAAHRGRMVEKITNHALLRLSDDEHWAIVRTQEMHKEPQQESFFKAGTLTGKSLLIRPVPAACHYSGAWPIHLDYVRLVPADDVRPCRTTSLPKDAFVVTGIADVFSWYRKIRLRTQADVDLLFGVHKHAGFNRLHYKLGGGCWEYPSKVPQAEPCIEPASHLKDEDYADGRDWLREMAGVDRLALAVASAKKHGMQIFGWIRLQNYGEHLAHGYPVSVFHRDNPHLYERSRGGDPIPARMSLAFPEVRQYELAIIREAIGYGMDGILIDFLRQLPAVCYADPVCERFRELHGQDAREALPTDPRLLKVQAGFTDIFLEEIRGALDEFEQKPELHVRIASPRLGHGLDPAAIAASGHVDEIIIEHRGPTAIAPDLEGVLDAAKGTGCRICPSYQRTYWGASRFPMRPDVIRRTSEEFYRLGARHISFYECTAGVMYPDFCRAIRRLRDPQEYFPIH